MSAASLFFASSFAEYRPRSFSCSCINPDPEDAGCVFGRSQNKKAGKQLGASTGAYCIKTKPPGMAVFVIQKDKVLMVGAADQAGSPDSSTSTSPSNSSILVGNSNCFPLGIGGSSDQEARSTLLLGRSAGDT